MGLSADVTPEVNPVDLYDTPKARNQFFLHNKEHKASLFSHKVRSLSCKQLQNIRILFERLLYVSIIQALKKIFLNIMFIFKLIRIFGLKKKPIGIYLPMLHQILAIQLCPYAN